MDTSKLTLRQQQVLALLITGHSNKEIAREMQLSIVTVKNHVTAIYTRLGCRGRLKLISKLLREES